MLSNWITEKQDFEKDYKIFKVNTLKKRNSGGTLSGNFVVLDSPQFANIIPITPAKEVILVRQYRHGIDEITLEIPGGLVDFGEEPIKAAARECLEETGYSSEQEPIWIGECFPNPAFMNNTCNSFVWFDVEQTGKQSLDGTEEIEIIKVPIKSIVKMLLNGELKNSMVLNAFLYYILKYGI